MRVRHCRGAYQLPDGLPEGAEVELVSFNGHGYWTVRHNGKLFKVYLACLNSGMIPPRKRYRDR